MIYGVDFPVPSEVKTKQTLEKLLDGYLVGVTTIGVGTVLPEVWAATLWQSTGTRQVGTIMAY